MAGKANGRKARNGGGEITMSDIARHAGVSPMTVSRALSDPPSVSDKMRRKVDAAVRQFGYLPNRIAGSLSSKRSNVIGLVVPSIRNSLYAAMIHAISDVARANGSVRLTVSDTGVGMDPGEAHRAFERFYRSDTPGVQSEPGSGLGLAIVRAIVEAYGGTVHAASPGPGQGSRFEVLLSSA